MSFSWYAFNVASCCQSYNYAPAHHQPLCKLTDKRQVEEAAMQVKTQKSDKGKGGKGGKSAGACVKKPSYKAPTPCCQPKSGDDTQKCKFHTFNYRVTPLKAKNVTFRLVPKGEKKEFAIMNASSNNMYLFNGFRTRCGKGLPLGMRALSGASKPVRALNTGLGVLATFCAYKSAKTNAK